jgi:hypothetical protein
MHVGKARQGDLIGRIFAHWTTAQLEQFFFENSISSPIFWLLFSRGGSGLIFLGSGRPLASNFGLEKINK